jgi:hypothetical protein
MPVIWADGTISTMYGADVAQSVNTIVPGVTYDFEVVSYGVTHPDGPKVQIYVDGELWVEETAYIWPWDTYAELTLGASPVSSSYLVYTYDVTMHFENVVWTMENVGGPHWTMMAVL